MRELSSGEQFMQLLAGKWVVQAICCAAELGVADALDTPQPVQQLAERLQVQADPLLRLLRVLSGEGLVQEHSSGEFSLTCLGQHLREGEQRQLARFVGSSSQWQPWLELPAAIRTGQCAFERTYKQPLFEFLTARPDQARLYDDAVDAYTRQQAEVLARAELLEGVKHVVDVGGGRGTLLLELLTRHSQLHGTLWDRHDVVQAAEPRFSEVSSRFTAQSGNFLEQTPPPADCYVLKHVLHNWPDTIAVEVLQRCRESLLPGGKILIVEGLRLPGNQRDLTKMMDLEMFVLTSSGRERSKPEFRKLLKQAGMRLNRTSALSIGAWALEVLP